MYVSLLCWAWAHPALPTCTEHRAPIPGIPANEDNFHFQTTVLMSPFCQYLSTSRPPPSSRTKAIKPPPCAHPPFLQYGVFHPAPASRNLKLIRLSIFSQNRYMHLPSPFFFATVFPPLLTSLPLSHLHPPLPRLATTTARATAPPAVPSKTSPATALTPKASPGPSRPSRPTTSKAPRTSS